MSASVLAAASNATYWSKRLNCDVSYISPKTILFPIEIDEKYVKVVSGEGVGWMVYPENEEWVKGCIEEIKE